MFLNIKNELGHNFSSILIWKVWSSYSLYVICVKKNGCIFTTKALWTKYLLLGWKSLHTTALFRDFWKLVRVEQALPPDTGWLEMEETLRQSRNNVIIFTNLDILSSKMETDMNFVIYKLLSSHGLVWSLSVVLLLSF